MAVSQSDSTSEHGARQQLSEWLTFVLEGRESQSDKPYFTLCFPSAEALDLYLAEVPSHRETDVRVVLRALLLSSGSLGIDRIWLKVLLGRYNSLLAEQELEPRNDYVSPRLSEYDRRLLGYFINKEKGPPPWEGITWILDLVPEFPQEALDALSGYILAHAQELPDQRIAGLSEALTIIRARYIGVPGADVGDQIASVLDLPSRSFERLVERFFAAEGYKTELTRPRKDGGRDVLARRDEPPVLQSLVIECKNWRSRVGVPRVRELLGSVTDEKATNGVVIASSGFTKPAREFAARNPRLSLTTLAELIPRLNLRLGANWPSRIDRLIVESQRHTP